MTPSFINKLSLNFTSRSRVIFISLSLLDLNFPSFLFHFHFSISSHFFSLARLKKSERNFVFTFHFSIVQNPLSHDTGLQVINPDSTRNDSRQLEWGGLHIAPRSPRSTIYKEYFHPTGAKQRLKYEQLAIQLELNTEQSLWAQL